MMFKQLSNLAFMAFQSSPEQRRTHFTCFVTLEEMLNSRFFLFLYRQENQNVNEPMAVE